MKESFKIVLFVFFFILSCNSKNEEQQKVTITSVIQKEEIDSNKVNRIKKDSIENEVKSNIKVIVLQCSNGYGHNDFNRTIESEISKKEGFTIIPFPNKKLVGVTFQGVYDKKYCFPIIEKLDVDYIIMTRFLGNIEEAVEIIDENFIWGYEIKILNVKSMNQKISIRKDNLAEYKDILNDIEKNGEKILNDIENLK